MTETKEEVKEETKEQNGNDIETRARDMGWKPKEEFSGPEDKWVDADKFVKNGEEILPVLRERFRHQEKELTELKGMMRDMALSQKAQTERAVSQAVEELERQRSDAILESDVNKVRALDQKIETVKKQPEVQVESAVKVSQTIIDWAESNTWFKESAPMRGFATHMYDEELRRDPDRSDREILRAVTAEVKKRFPEKFGNPRREEAGMVESGSGKKGKSSKSWEDLPGDIRTIADSLVKKKILTKEEYLKNYQW